jgi:hypothetical protein
MERFYFLIWQMSAFSKILRTILCFLDIGTSILVIVHGSNSDLVSTNSAHITVCFFLLSQENGLLHVPKGQTQNAQAQMFSDPNMAMDMMKKNLSMIIPQVDI